MYENHPAYWHIPLPAWLTGAVGRSVRGRDRGGGRGSSAMRFGERLQRRVLNPQLLRKLTEVNIENNLNIHLVNIFYSFELIELSFSSNVEIIICACWPRQVPVGTGRYLLCCQSINQLVHAQFVLSKHLKGSILKGSPSINWKSKQYQCTYVNYLPLYYFMNNPVDEDDSVPFFLLPNKKSGARFFFYALVYAIFCCLLLTAVTNLPAYR